VSVLNKGCLCNTHEGVKLQRVRMPSLLCGLSHTHEYCAEVKSTKNRSSKQKLQILKVLGTSATFTYTKVTNSTGKITSSSEANS
jgi:hypothetical protein